MICVVIVPPIGPFGPINRVKIQPTLKADIRFDYFLFNRSNNEVDRIRCLIELLRVLLKFGQKAGQFLITHRSPPGLSPTMLGTVSAVHVAPIGHGSAWTQNTRSTNDWQEAIESRGSYSLRAASRMPPFPRLPKLLARRRRHSKLQANASSPEQVAQAVAPSAGAWRVSCVGDHS